jgi:Glycosyl hydrolase family 9
MTPRVLVGHAGYLCDAPKRAILPAGESREFVVQDMEHVVSEALGRFEDWKPVYGGRLAPHHGALGDWLLADFSEWRRPGLYRIVVPGTDLRSAAFPIHDGVLATIPRLCLDYLHAQRCGPFENEWRGPCHLDDGVLSSTGAAVDVVGGWHDAGDVRKWMVHSLNPILGLADLRRRLAWRPGRLWAEDPWGDDLEAEVAWAASFALKMQDPATGMFWEDVGGGGESRLPPDKWWYENHAGCGGDNSENRYTDNVRGSGDERPIRDQYTPLAQYTMITVLLRASGLLEKADESLAARCRDSALGAWRFVRGREADAFHAWASVRAWAVLAGLELAEHGLLASAQCEDLLRGLLGLFDPELAWFWGDASRTQPHRGILHSAQPLLALATFLERHPGAGLAARGSEILEACGRGYVEPLRGSTPFGFVPFGLYRNPPRTPDLYRPWRHGLSLRLFMPAHSDPPINHGLAGHWTSWAHALAVAGAVLGKAEWTQAALDQVHWLLGRNPFDASVVTGVGHHHPVPHSRFEGAIPGGVMNGPRGTAADEPFLDMEAQIDWGSTEYWNLPLANLLQALAYLVPPNVPASRKIGRYAHG